MTASLYIHVPFCSQKCDYCDFYSVPITPDTGTQALMDSYVDAVLGDIEDQINLFNVDNIPTVYIGGGTPSVLGLDRVTRLLTFIKTRLTDMGTAHVEFTVEANPESTDEAFLEACVEGGVSRISLGVQSFHESSRKAVHRTGSRAQIEKALALVTRYYPDGFSADLVTGLPFQSEAVIMEDIKTLLSFNPAHVSIYSLILEPQTPLGKAIKQGAVSLPSSDEADQFWIAGRDLMESSRLRQYEVSNFCLPNKTCAHNIRYWRMENWLGAGPAASGTIINDETGTGKRLTYPADIKSYIKMPRPRINHAIIEELGRTDLIKETLLMGFRYCEGPDKALFKQRFGREIEDAIPKTISLWSKRDFFQTSQTLKPSKQGLLFVNSFLREAFEELEHFYYLPSRIPHCP
ncbi:MAG: radical SAM family heme chaperone HemW [Treponema sp.]|jgi:oxygen-independent coproporphyrinogen-3 oxidase|nr:radical SAM family heme chaperone HemW [Treponema sp.]